MSSTECPVIFLVGHNPDTAAVSGDLFAETRAFHEADQLDDVIDHMRRGLRCDVIILATDMLQRPADFDRLLAVRKKAPKIIIFGVDPFAKIALHCLNRGACDFLTVPLEPDDVIHAVETALTSDSSDTRYIRNPDAIVGSSPVGGWIDITASSELEQFRRLQRFSDVLFASRLPNQVCEDIKMAVEEVGRNAVEWGNRFDPDKQVHISYCMFDDRVVIKIEDEGDGFTPEAVPDPTEDPLKTMRDRMDAGKRPGGYGVFLIQKLVDEIVYNEKGNAVLMIKYLPET